MENHLTPIGISVSFIGISISFVGISISFVGISTSSTGISARQSLYIDISVLVQETPFMDSRRKKINGLFEKGVFVVIAERDVL